MTALGRAARRAARLLAKAPDDRRTLALTGAARAIRAAVADILEANRRDLEAARASGLAAPLLDRLALDADRLAAVAAGLEAIAAGPDPLGRRLERRERPNGLVIDKVSVPIGVIGVIYESRPNVTADAGALCIRSGNAAILRGGSESVHTSAAIRTCLRQGLGEAGLPETAVQAPDTTDRAAVGHMLRMADAIDLLIPRGGKGLVARVMSESRVPVLAHQEGICHTYIHAKADPAMARRVTVNAKMRRPAICGATETLLVDAAAAAMLPALADDLLAAGCALRGDARACALDPRLTPATDADWRTEYLDAILSVRVVPGLDQAIEHINDHGSHHTDAIVTDDSQAAARFLREVDSGIVMHNTSTQFADGGEFGMGAEIGIATGKLHARGPVGAEQLTSSKYQVTGQGQVRP